MYVNTVRICTQKNIHLKWWWWDCVKPIKEKRIVEQDYKSLLLCIHLKVKGFLIELSCEAWYMLQFQTPSQTLGWSWVKVVRSSSGVLCWNISWRKPFVQLGKQNNNHVAIDNCKKQVKHFIPVRSPKELHLGWMHLMSWYDPQAAAFGVSFLRFLPLSSLFAPKHSHTINLDCVVIHSLHLWWCATPLHFQSAMNNLLTWALLWLRFELVLSLQTITTLMIFLHLIKKGLW